MHVKVPTAWFFMYLSILCSLLPGQPPPTAPLKCHWIHPSRTSPHAFLLSSLPQAFSLPQPLAAQCGLSSAPAWLLPCAQASFSQCGHSLVYIASYCCLASSVHWHPGWSSGKWILPRKAKIIASLPARVHVPMAHDSLELNLTGLSSHLPHSRGMRQPRA